MNQQALAELKRQLSQGDEVVQNICKDFAALKAVNDHDPDNRESIRAIIGDLDRQASWLLLGWYDLHAAMSLLINPPAPEPAPAPAIATEVLAQSTPVATDNAVATDEKPQESKPKADPAPAVTESTPKPAEPTATPPA